VADKWDPVRKGLDKWMGLVPKFGVVWIVLDILPHLPDALAKKIVDKALSALGLGD
jgi:hypothetical protein